MRSSAVTVPGNEVLPALSVAVTVKSSPLVLGGLIATSNLPSSPAVAVPIGLPFSSFTVTVLPGSAVPVTWAPSSETSRLSGLFGGVSGAITSVGVDVLPALSVAVTSTCSPLFFGGLRSMAKLPLPSAVPSAMTLPWSSLTVTLLPGSALPVIWLPLLEMTTSVG